MSSIFLSFPEASFLLLYSWPNWFFTPGWSWHSLVSLHCKWLGTFDYGFKAWWFWLVQGEVFLSYFCQTMCLFKWCALLFRWWWIFFPLVFPRTFGQALLPSVSPGPLGSKHPNGIKCVTISQDFEISMWRNRERSRGGTEYPRLF